MFGGFYTGIAFAINATDFNLKGNISNGDTFELTIPSSTVGFTNTSYPYPANGQSEDGTLVYNDKTYNYVINYDGSNIADVQVTGSYNVSFNIDLSNGTILWFYKY